MPEGPVNSTFEGADDRLEVLDVDRRVDSWTVRLDQFRARIEALAGMRLLQHQNSVVAREADEALIEALVVGGESK